MLTLTGSTTPRLWTRPLVQGKPGPCGCGCALTPVTSRGFSAVRFAHDVLGITLLPWQRWLLIHALELGSDGRFRFRTLLVLVARQNGKTTLVEVKNLWKMFVLRVPLVIGTAQNLDISEESWDKAVEIVESIPELNSEVRHVDRTNGKKALRLANGSRWKIAAASRKGGRGLSGDDVNLDELREHQTWESWAAVTKTTMARRNPQVWAYSNAGDDKSVVLNALHEKGRAAVESPDNADSSLGLFEWSAPDDVKCTCAVPTGHSSDCRLQDRTAWAQSNPSLGYTVTEEALASALATDPEPIFRTECLCQRVETLAESWQVIGQARWEARADEASQVVDPVCFAVDVTPDRRYACIGVAGRRADGDLHVEVVEHRSGTSWVVERALQLSDTHQPLTWVIDPSGPAGSLLTDFEAAGIEVTLQSARDAAQACGSLYDGIAGDAPNTWHIGQGMLTAALAGALKRPLADAWAWDRRSVSVDISPLVVVTSARWGFMQRCHQPTGLMSAAAWR